jgi:tRNA synthetases class I (I, L, M and V)
MSQNYKDTLNLPRTDFPIKADLPAREPEMLRAWEETRLDQQIQKSREGRALVVLHDGPPFANGDVHMGTALNKSSVRSMPSLTPTAHARKTLDYFLRGNAHLVSSG